MTSHQMYENIVVGVRDHESGLDGVALARQLAAADDLLVVAADEHRPLSRFMRISTLETLADRPVSPLLVVPARSLEMRDDRSPASARA